MQMLVTLGADVHARDIFGSNALHWASANGAVKAVAALLELGAKASSPIKRVDADDIEEERGHVPAALTPLELAREGGHAEVQRLLLKALEGNCYRGEKDGAAGGSWPAGAPDGPGLY
jgi:hypothetical protein